MAQVPDPRTVIKLVEEYRDEWEIPPDADDFRPSDGATNVQVSKPDFQPGEVDLPLQVSRISRSV